MHQNYRWLLSTTNTVSHDLILPYKTLPVIRGCFSSQLSLMISIRKCSSVHSLYGTIYVIISIFQLLFPFFIISLCTSDINRKTYLQSAIFSSTISRSSVRLPLLSSPTLNSIVFSDPTSRLYYLVIYEQVSCFISC